MTADERIEKLERELTAAQQRSRRRMLAALAIAAVLASAWLVTESPRPAYARDHDEEAAGVVRAREFVLVDEMGRTRGRAAVTRVGPTLMLFDEQGQTRVMIDVLRCKPTLSLLDENGRVCASIGSAVADAPDAQIRRLPESSIRLYDPEGKIIWQAPR